MQSGIEIDVAEAARLLREGAFLLDVREPYEIQLAAIDGATAVPMRQVPESLARLPADRPVLVLCHHGSRSLYVTQYLRAQGFANAVNVAGGIEAWSLEIEPAVPRY